MNKLSKIALGISTSLSTLFVAVNSVHATYTTYSTTDDEAAALLGGLSLVCWIPICIIGLVSLVFSILMIVDAAKRDEKVLPGKIKWILIIWFLSPIGGLVYLFTRKKKMDAMTKGSAGTREVS